MTARLRKLLSDLAETFWLIPALLIGAAVLLALLFISLDRQGVAPHWLIEGGWLYGGGATGARTLLGMIAGSTVGIAGTVFTITIAALTLAAGQMGPRLLRNFVRDRGNQVTLGLFLGTFACSLMILRTVRTVEEGDFVPHISLTFVILLAFACVAVLVYFVGHIASRINVDTVIELVGEDAQAVVRRLTTDEPQPPHSLDELFRDAIPISDGRRGYLQQLDTEGLADWAAECGIAVRMLVRQGDYVFPGAPIALVTRAVEGADAAIRKATALGHRRGSPSDLDFAVRQMVEVAVRALSPGINDPHTAISVLDRLGALLCEIVPLRLPSGVTSRDGSPVLFVPALGYDELVSGMFDMIRRHSASNADLLIRILEVLGSVLRCERDPERIAVLRTQADLVIEDAERCIANATDLKAVRDRRLLFDSILGQDSGGQVHGPARGRNGSWCPANPATQSADGTGSGRPHQQAS